MFFLSYIRTFILISISSTCLINLQAMNKYGQANLHHLKGILSPIGDQVIFEQDPFRPIVNNIEFIYNTVKNNAQSPEAHRELSENDIVNFIRQAKQIKDLYYANKEYSVLKDIFNNIINQYQACLYLIIARYGSSITNNLAEAICSWNNFMHDFMKENKLSINAAIFEKQANEFLQLILFCIKNKDFSSIYSIHLSEFINAYSRTNTLADNYRNRSLPMTKSLMQSIYAQQLILTLFSKISCSSFNVTDITNDIFPHGTKAIKDLFSLRDSFEKTFNPDTQSFLKLIKNEYKKLAIKEEIQQKSLDIIADYLS